MTKLKPDTLPPDLSCRLSLSVDEVAAALGVSPRKVWELTNRGEMPSVKLDGRVLYPVDGLRRWLAERQVGGAK